MSFFKAYDMRGEFERDFDLDTVWRIGRWLPVVLGAKRFLVGRDVRDSSVAIRDALCRGLMEAGCGVDDLGLTTTPMVYFFSARGEYDASVQITASHNPAAHNGMKVSRDGTIPVGFETGLNILQQRVVSGTLPPLAEVPGCRRDITGRDEFVTWLRSWCPDLSGLRFAVDCSDGMAGLIARDLFGEGPIYLNEVPDGKFPHHSPNPLEAASREQISACVREQGLDAGIIFDGDVDRVMFVDEQGRFVQPDYLIPVIARRFLRREPGATVIYDVRTSRGVIETLRAEGALPVMGKVGHAFAKVLMRESGAVCGGELAGHYYFRDFYCCDSGELAALLVLEALLAARQDNVTFSELMAPICRYANSGELNFRVKDKTAAMDALLAAMADFGEPLERSTIDGVRMDFTDGWVSVRQSNTEAYLRVIVESTQKHMLLRWQQTLTQALEPHLSELK